MLKKILALLLLAAWVTNLYTRSIWQPQDDLPSITTFWVDNQNHTHSLRHSRLEKWAIFERYSEEEIQRFSLPKHIIMNNKKKITQEKLDTLCTSLVQDLKKAKKPSQLLTNFTILKDADFNYKEGNGNLIVKCNDYPLVIKIFCETPQSFVRPFSKGIVPSFLFSMGGGINRFLAGFTRIPNLIAIQNIIEENPEWKQRIILPRKWYWLAPETRYFTIRGRNFSDEPNQTYTITVPSTYAIISDYIPCKKTFSLKSSEDRHCAIQLQTLFKNKIDPHICNFFFDYDGKIAIIDTEHFASIMGLDESDLFANYGHLVFGLGNRFIARTLFHNKAERVARTRKNARKTLCIR
ncbi:MAG: hypothetical protein UV79_C0014G0007 [candidate division TM6 bacterium GW2011_GWF2_43_17]|nr:MAG: hypothetical protein UV79_C0014G0007 [candidate division TM6 bacterium GW2011_GWF2_43_17]